MAGGRRLSFSFVSKSSIHAVCVMALGILAVPVIGEQFQCASPPYLKITPSTSSDGCWGSFDGYNTQLRASFQFAASMTGNGNAAPQFDAFLDGDANSCVEHVSNRSMDGHMQYGTLEVVCTAALGEGGHSIQVTGMFDNGEPGCVGVSDTAFVTPTVIGPPTLKLIGPRDSEICYGTRAFSALFTYEKAGSLQGVPLVYDAWLRQGETVLQYCTVTESGTGIVVTCDTNASEGIPTGSYTVLLSAKLSESPGNSDSPLALCQHQFSPQSAVATVTVKEPPIITITQLQPKPVCLGSKAATTRFSYTLDNGGASPQVQPMKPLGQITGGLSAMATECTSEVEEQSPSSGFVTVTCQGDFSYIGAAWLVKVAVEASCSGATAISGLAGLGNNANANATADVASPGLHMHTGNTSNSSGSNQVSPVTVTKQASTAAVTTTLEVSMPLSCCTTGTQVIAWARSNTGISPASTCFKPPVPGSGKNRCSKNHGFYHRGPLASGKMFVVKQPPASTLNPKCNSPGGFEVGEVSARCERQGGRLPDLLTITMTRSRYNEPRQRMFLFSCDKPLQSGCTMRWEKIPGIPDWQENGRAVSELQVEIPKKCTCENVYWAVREQGLYRDGVPMSVCEKQFKVLGR